ncbi:polyprenyl synthetase family protein [Candidatus Paraluminiphilus aquimaris]|uniref:Polyprenyl synthetase family protein n=1 Tax=Candidatus Paraluminiphilus aquimaris TaxID=2518994 RepID=A0ABY6Q545_9GAMM|nr:farnesyl diphosphate synthase [Candidatus Paraluminiphilus aquimaris]UZP74063.1 polyprenyl synthetase family protein [Candidatus Paraluminiphilus aquimaris]
MALSSNIVCSDPALEAALAYALANPGKQLRSRLCRETATMVSGEAMQSATRVGEAIECLHTYSLIHDDLPSMDNDDLRRGKPTVHRAFDEATAILVGDGLQAFAFEWVSETDGLSDTQKIKLVKLLSKSVGFDGMVGGQAMDIAAEGKSLDVSALKEVHLRKTGALIEASVLAGAICGEANAGQIEALGRFSRNIGLAFQVMDDVLDVTASSETLGKTAGKDIAADKSTYVACMGVDAASAYANDLLNEALALLSPFGQAADALSALSKLLVHRKN